MLNGLASRFPRLVTVGVCYLALTGLELVFFHDWMTFTRQVGVGLQAGFAAALIYGGVVQSRHRGGRYSFPATR
jgi:hypothetical protein